MALGPVLNARSDTFTIRVYGDSIHPVSAEKVSVLCEAVVQRLPEYVDANEAATKAADQLTSSLNKKFGRRFVIRSFRWLDSASI
ncbi:hypothetical protein SH580_03490 [Coraliomargarita algicola]|uniref:Uncharacterized protein n=1 Tax=Coraliomargarita algicola TaxID=3092156 RepID=A0ABZ0RMW4_9BACT|nr:hypothetical protein [Coraliomargarita sp. J2-16]WPJ96768.1 hypothetical protein SH580_03490 [Coraliomargarita sp. J2-16]